MRCNSSRRGYRTLLLTAPLLLVSSPLAAQTFVEVMEQHGGKMLGGMALIMAFLVVACIRVHKLNVQLAQADTERKRIHEEREKMQQQLRHSQRLESIGRLSGAIAHDFNNLLTVINGYSELLLMTTDKQDPHHDTYMQITQACWRARELTYQLLTFSRRQITRMDPVDLNKIILDSASMFRSLLGANIKLSTALNTDIGLTLADSGQIHQVLLNLVVNAKDAMPDGGHFSISTAIVQLDIVEAAGLGVVAGAYIAVAVADTGAGMSRETQEKIFEPFFTTKGEKGSGFGLATAYGIIGQCKGAIYFQSAVGAGTTFTLYLPVTDISRVSLAEAGHQRPAA